jgi:hypothetical protein
MAVLVENSLLISFVGVLLLPWLLRSWVPVTVRTVWACAGLTWLLLGRFALAPMVDLWAAVLMIATVVLLRRRTAVKLMAAGLFAGMAFNVRPAYLLPLVLTLAVVLLSQRLAGLWFAAGTVIALMPQSLVNLTHGGNWLPLPPNLFMLTQLQAVNASYVVRYDTVRLPDRIPSQVFCSPDMAAVVDGHPPESTLALASLYLHNLPQSILFIAQKAAGSLHWPLSAPWFEPTGAADQVFALLVTTVTVLGAAALVKAQSRSGFRSVHVAVLAGAAIWWGSLITIITPSPETRFALPLVMFGIAGCALLVTRRPSRRWVAGSLTAVLVIFAVATLGLSHPAAPGPARVLKCAAA